MVRKASGDLEVSKHRHIGWILMITDVLWLSDTSWFDRIHHVG